MIVVICGPPGAGKTTLTAALRRHLESEGLAVTTLHSDEFSSRTYEQLADRVAVDVSAARGASRDAASRTVLIVDGTFYKRSWRELFRTRFDTDLSDAGVRFVHVSASLETCLERNRVRAHDESISEQGVHVVYREFDPLDADLTIDTDEVGISEAVARVVAALETWQTATALE